MAIIERKEDNFGRYIKLAFDIQVLFDRVKLETAYYGRRFPEQFDSIVITEDESDLFLNELRKVVTEVATYLQYVGLDRQGFIYDGAKAFVLGVNLPEQKLESETTTQVVLMLKDNFSASDNHVNLVAREIEQWVVQSLTDRLLNPTIYKGELKPASLQETIEKQIFYLTLK